MTHMPVNDPTTHTGDSPKPVTIIPVNRKKFPTLLIITILLATIMIRNINYLQIPDPSDNLIYEILDRSWYFGFLVLILGYMFLSLAQYCKIVFDRNAKLTISSEGIDENLSIFSCGKIAWEEITGVEIRKSSRLKMILIYIKVKDPQRLLLRTSKWKQLLILRKRTKRTGTPMVIVDKQIDYNIKALKALLETHIKLRSEE